MGRTCIITKGSCNGSLNFHDLLPNNLSPFAVRVLGLKDFKIKITERQTFEWRGWLTEQVDGSSGLCPKEEIRQVHVMLTASIEGCSAISLLISGYCDTVEFIPKTNHSIIITSCSCEIVPSWTSRIQGDVGDPLCIKLDIAVTRLLPNYYGFHHIVQLYA